MRSSNSPVSKLAQEAVGGERLPVRDLRLFELLQPTLDNVEPGIDVVEFAR